MKRLKAQKDWWDEFGPDSSANWDFDGVPDSEVVACCVWEYACESRTIKMRADSYWCRTRHITYRREYEINPALKVEHDVEAVRISARTKQLGFDEDAFFECFWKTDYPLMEIYDSVTSLVRDGA